MLAMFTTEGVLSRKSCTVAISSGDSSDALGAGALIYMHTVGRVSSLFFAPAARTAQAQPYTFISMAAGAAGGGPVKGKTAA
jgi:hypothetical protein